MPAPASVAVRCPRCSAKLRAAAGLVGLVGRAASCPRCRARIVIEPAQAPDQTGVATVPDIDLSAMTRTDHAPLPDAARS